MLQAIRNWVSLNSFEKQTECSFLLKHGLSKFDTQNECSLVSLSYESETTLIILCLAAYCWILKRDEIKESRLIIALLLASTSFVVQSTEFVPYINLFLISQFSSPNSLIFQILLCLYIYYHPQYFPLLLFSLLQSLSNFNLKKITISVYVISLAGIFAYASSQVAQDFIQRYYLSFNLHSSLYQPSFGIFWYFNALLLPEYRAFFNILIPTLPWFSSIFLSKIFKKASSFQEGIIVSALIVEFFSLKPDMLNIVISLGLLIIDHYDICSQIQYLFFFLFGFAFPTALTPFMYDLWVRLGSGNANFMFFAGLGSWVFLSIFISEYVKTHEKVVNTESF